MTKFNLTSIKFISFLEITNIKNIILNYFKFFCVYLRKFYQDGNLYFLISKIKPL